MAVDMLVCFNWSLPAAPAALTPMGSMSLTWANKALPWMLTSEMSAGSDTKAVSAPIVATCDGPNTPKLDSHRAARFIVIV